MARKDDDRPIQAYYTEAPVVDLSPPSAMDAADFGDISGHVGEASLTPFGLMAAIVSIGINAALEGAEGGAPETGR